MKRNKNSNNPTSGSTAGPPFNDGGRRPSAGKSTADWRGQDPEFKSESARYANPLPSRVLIQQIIADSDTPLTLDDLIGRFSLTKLNEQEALEKRVIAMVRERQLFQDLRGAFTAASVEGTAVPVRGLVEGRVTAHRDGYGFLAVDGGGTDLFLPPPQMRGLMDGDRISARVASEDGKGRREGVSVRLIERGRQTLVGRLHAQQGVFTVIPSSPKLPEVIVASADRGGAKHGQVVVVELLSAPSDRSLPTGKVIEVLGDHLDAGLEIVSAIRTHGLPHDWPEAVEREAAAFAPDVRSEQWQGREDLRDLGLMTIDGADARDFDDAVYAEKVRGWKGGGWKLWVAIADVSAYVTPDSALDKEALNRGNSVYFPAQVIPMLPEALSNGLCSINPDVDRLCMVCEMRVSRKGEVSKSRFYQAVMRSKARLIYEDVAAALEAPEARHPRVKPELIPALQILKDVFEALFAARSERGAIDFEGTETKIVFGEGRKIEKIVPVTRNIAHRMIEECMVAANVESAKLVDKHKMPALYRVHADPDSAKVAVLREFLSGLGLSLGGGLTPKAADYSATLGLLKGRPDAMLIQNVMLRSMMQARYSPQNTGHFGLALSHYAHFTSPIRRYPDLLLHRAIKHVLLKGKPKSFAYTEQQMEAFAAQCSITERRADDATRDVATFLKCEYISHHVGEEFAGLIISLAPFGMFVELDNLFVDGMIHVSTLDDYYQFDARHQRLVGEKSQRVFALGDRLRVKVARVSLDERKIELALVGKDGGVSGSRRGGGAKQKAGEAPAPRQGARKGGPPPADSSRDAEPAAESKGPRRRRKRR